MNFTFNIEPFNIIIFDNCNNGRVCEYSAVLSFKDCYLFVLSTLQILFCLHLIQRMLLYPVKKFLLVHQFHIVVFCLLPQGNTVSKRIVLSPPINV